MDRAEMTAFMPAQQGLRQQEQPPGRLGVVLPRCVEAVPSARARVVTALREWLVDTCTVDDAALLVSELLSNAVQHTTGPEIMVSVSRRGQWVRCGVHDQGLTLPRLPRNDDPHTSNETGRGLRLVEAIADRWGVLLAPARERGAKEVWFEIAEAVPPDTLPRRQPGAVSDSPVPAAIPVDPLLSRRVLEASADSERRGGVTGRIGGPCRAARPGSHAHLTPALGEFRDSCLAPWIPRESGAATQRPLDAPVP